MRRCRRVLDSLGDYLSSDLDPRARQFVQTHLQMCTRCAAEFQAARALLDRLPSEGLERAPSEVKARLLTHVPSRASRAASPFRPRRLAWGVGSAAASVATALALLYVVLRPGAPGGQTHTDLDLLPLPGRTQALPSGTGTSPLESPGDLSLNSAEAAGGADRMIPALPGLPNRGAIGFPGGRLGAPPLPDTDLVSLDPREALIAPLPNGFDDATIVPLPAGPGARELAPKDHPHPRATGAIVGQVFYNDEPQSDVVLRLVHLTSSTFVPERRAVTDEAGRYRFLGVLPGRYRVYVYTGDNRNCFNRETPPLEVRTSLVKASPLALGRLLLPSEPPSQTRANGASPTLFSWGEGPGAREYEVTVSDTISRAPAFHARVSAPEVVLPAATLLSGRTYEIRVLALADDGSFLGSTPGSGAVAWTVTAR